MIDRASTLLTHLDHLGVTLCSGWLPTEEDPEKRELRYWIEPGGQPVDPAIARKVIADGDVVGGGDSLFEGTPQTWRANRESKKAPPGGEAERGEGGRLQINLTEEAQRESALIERVARAMCKTTGANPDEIAWIHTPEFEWPEHAPRWTAFRADAAKQIAALRALGLIDK